MGGDGELPGQFALAKDFDAERAVGEAGATERLFVNARAVLEHVKGVEVDRQVTSGVAGIVKAALGNTADEGHLAAFKSDANGAAGPGGLAFATATAGFAMAAGLALTEAFATVPGAGPGFEIM
jgi:hypothetical protein